MLSEKRHKLILEKLEKESVVYLNDLVKYLNTSESTIRRDLTAKALTSIPIIAGMEYFNNNFPIDSSPN